MSRKRALIYTRISKDRAGAGLGVDRQREDCQELATRLGWSVVGTHSDNDMSAYSGKPRPGYKALLTALEAGAADAVLVWHTDRLHRRPTELEEYIAICEKRSVVTQTVKAGPLDLATPSGRMVARQLGVVARYEVEHMIERSKRAKLQAATSGLWRGGRRPFGYEADGVTVREDEAAAVRQAATDLLAGMSLRALAKDWNDRGVTTSTGGPWKPTQVRKVLTRARTGGRIEHEGEILGVAEWSALLEEGTWLAVRALCADPKRRTTPGSARRWLGTSIYRCGTCGKGLRASTAGTGGRGPALPAYRCEDGKHVVRNAALTDEYVAAVVIERLSRPDAAELGRSTSPPVADTADLHAERLVIQARLDELVDLHGQGAITAAQLVRGSTSARQQLDDLEARLAASSAGNVLEGVTGPSAGQIWPTLPLSRQRAILDVLMTVTVEPAPRGRPPGWRPGEPYFRPESIRIEAKA